LFQGFFNEFITDQKPGTAQGWMVIYPQKVEGEVMDG